MKEKCLRQIIGSCGGCDIQAMAREKTWANQGQEEIIAKRIQTELCPSGETMQLPEKPKKKVWG